MKTQPKCFILTPMPDIDTTIVFWAGENPHRMPEKGQRQQNIELQIRFNTGAKIDATFPKRAGAIAFLGGFA